MADEKSCVDLSPTTVQAIADAFASKMPVTKVPRPKQNVLAIISLCLTVLAFIGAGVGVWVTSSNKTTALDSRLTAVENRQQNFTVRVGTLEDAKTSSANTATEVKDLKENFNRFLDRYDKDSTDIQASLRDLQGRKGK